MWIVIPRTGARGIPEYAVVSSVTGVCCISMDCYKWAKYYADILNGGKDGERRAQLS